MTKIRVLDEQTINKIAAGEVIENPSSVVKELVENALDAGSTEISVEIKEGGRQLIRISDNGCGMSPDDAILCLERHATSKIRQVEDIHDILTMGFRGEAIPSIASISKMNILTTPAKEGEKSCQGTMVQVEGGKILSCTPAARSQGTTIEVKSLFFNIPVRKKFQKSPSYDTQEILKILTNLALGYPHIKIELISDQKLLLNTPLLPADHSFQEKLGFRIESVLGRDFFSSLTPVSFSKDQIVLEGYIGLPFHHRQNRTGQYLFINHRAVQSPLISFAIKEGYGTTLPANRYPLFVLHLQMPGHLVDVNVHPQKKEVRLRQDQKLKESILDAVQKALHKNPCHHEFEIPIKEDFKIASPSTDYEQILHPSPLESQVKVSTPVHEAVISKKTIPTFETPSTFSFKKPPTPNPEVSTFQFTPKKKTPQILATLPGYIILEANETLDCPNLPKKLEGLCLINQKNAYARIFYERSLSQQPHPIQGIQTLLFPVTIELSTHDTLVLQEHLPALQKMGFGIKEFGENAFIVDSIPELIKQEKLASCILSIVQDLKEFQDTKKLQKEKEKQLALLACKSALPANKQLSVYEAQELLNQLLECQMPFQCPLGKPTLAKLSLEDLAKLF